MTSVTLHSGSSQLNGGYTSASVTDELSNSKVDFDGTRTNKRSLAIPSSGESSCKKRRKQSTPIRISTTDSSEPSPAADSLEEGVEMKQPLSPKVHRCPVCYIYFDALDQLQSHMMFEHNPVECKKNPVKRSTPLHRRRGRFMESPETSMGSFMRPEMQWLNEIQNLPFNPASNPMFMSLPHFMQPEMKPMRVFNPDAYCNHCSKEFCNKYFLKTHKANKHGIYPNMSSESSISKQAMPSFELPTTKTEPKAVYVLNPFTSIFPNSAPNQMVGNLLENKPNDSATIINGQSSSSGSDKDDQLGEEISSHSTTQTESTSIKNEHKATYPETSTKLPVEQSSQELDLSYRLRMKMGVMNPKAFCEICCKEYCNKYFLRTHKLKRHGIYTPEDKDKDSTTTDETTNTVQTSPLNLIMTEQTSSDCKTTSPSCDICNIRFQNASLAHLHNVTVHAKLGPKDDEADRSPQATRKQELLKVTEKSLNAEAISEDLQKLQTMISQLNDLDANKGAVICKFCNKEFENQLQLPAHMMSEHGTAALDEAREHLDKVNAAADVENTSNNNTLCDICGKEVQNADEMTRHIMEFHTNNQSSMEGSRDDFVSFASGEKSSGGATGRLSNSAAHVAERRVSTNVTPTSSYCEICNKELCNKYFMKTHMQRMHGIEIENGAQIGGVVCDICNKELCSKYFLRVHKHNTHGIIEYGSNLIPTRKTENETTAAPPALTTLRPPTPAEPDPALKPADLADMSHRYFTHFTEVCTICSRRFRSTKWLKAHLIADHGQAGVEKWTEIEHQLQQSRSTKSTPMIKTERTSPNLRIPNGSQDQKMGIQNFISSLFGADDSSTKIYQCSFCPFTTPLLPLLFVHERSHSINMEDNNMKHQQILSEHELLQRQILSTTQNQMLIPSSMIKEEDISKDNNLEQHVKKQHELEQVPPEIEQSLKELAKKTQLPTTYAIPQEAAAPDIVDHQDDASAVAAKRGYVMQAFLLEESTSPERRGGVTATVVPSVVFLPMLQKQTSPITVTFTLTPA